MPEKYIKKPVTVEVIEFTGTVENLTELSAWGLDPLRVSYKNPQGPVLTIDTLEGDHFANMGDMIIKGVAGEFYPCKKDIFERTYYGPHDFVHTETPYMPTIDPNKSLITNTPWWLDGPTCYSKTGGNKHIGLLCVE